MKRGIRAAAFAVVIAITGAIISASPGVTAGNAVTGSPSAAAAIPPTASPDWLRLPARERFVYLRILGDRKDTLELDLSRRTAAGSTWFELASRASDEDALYVLSAADFSMKRSEVTTRAEGSLIKRSTEVIEEAPPPEGELLIDANAPFLQRLRFIPFATKPSYKLGFQGAAAIPGFSIVLSVAGREMVSAGGKSWDCWRLEMGATGVLGALVAKSKYWYTVGWPHFLVRSEGPSSYPGSPPLRLELQSYEATP